MMGDQKIGGLEQWMIIGYCYDIQASNIFYSRCFLDLFWSSEFFCSETYHVCLAAKVLSKPGRLAVIPSDVLQCGWETPLTLANFKRSTL